MKVRDADVLAISVRQDDATSSHIFAVVRALNQAGVGARIVCNHPPGPLPADIHPLVIHAQATEYRPARDLTILEYFTWFPLAESFRIAPGVSVFVYHGVTPPQFSDTEEDRDRLQLAEINTMLVWHAHLAIASSPFTAEELVRHTGYPPERIRVVPYGVDSAVYSQSPPAETLQALRTQWGLQQRRVLLFTSEMASHKRIDLLIDALAQLVGEGEDLHLLVVGNKESNSVALVEKLQTQALRLGVGERVTFTGNVADLKPYLHLADALILPGQYEGFGAPLLEGMAAGLPLVASASGAVPWVLDAGSGEEQTAGLLFTPGDAVDLARQIRRVLTDASLRTALIARGHRRVQALTAEKFAANFQQAITEAEQLAGTQQAMQRQSAQLHNLADVALRDYRVRSGAPVIGRLIEWVRMHSTTHLKEAYLDRMVERQVTYNRMLADEVHRLQAEVHRLQTQVEALQTMYDKEEAS